MFEKYEKHYDLHSSTNIIRIMNSRGMKLAGYLTHKRRDEKFIQLLAKKPEGMTQEWMRGKYYKVSKRSRVGDGRWYLPASVVVFNQQCYKLIISMRSRCSLSSCLTISFSRSLINSF